jgi:hypothetical protein
MPDSIGAQRQSRDDPRIFTAIEKKIVGIELEELEATRRTNPCGFRSFLITIPGRR